MKVMSNNENTLSIRRAVSVALISLACLGSATAVAGKPAADVGGDKWGQSKYTG